MIRRTLCGAGNVGASASALCTGAGGVRRGTLSSGIGVGGRTCLGCVVCQKLGNLNVGIGDAGAV